MFKYTISFIVVAGMVLALVPTAQAAIIVVGDSLIPSGLSEGDTFHLAFVSSTTTDATPTDIADYNTLDKYQYIKVTFSL